MGWFDWLKCGELRRMETLQAKLAMQDEDQRDIKRRHDRGDEQLYNMLADINVRMQAGDVWADVYNEAIGKLSENIQTNIRDATLRMLSQHHQKGVLINMTQNPVFGFPESKCGVFSNGTEVTAQSSDNDQCKEHSDR